MKSWKAFFLILLFFGLASAIIPWFYHQKQTLTIEELNRNSELWKLEQPKSYNLRVFVEENGTNSNWVFRIEKMKILSVSKNGKFLTEGDGLEYLPNSVFEKLQNWLIYKSQDDQLPYITASFHSQFGYPLRAVLRRKSPEHRIEIRMFLELKIT